MKKADIVTKIVDMTQSSRKDTELFLNSFIKVVTDAVKDGERVTLTGFGTFESRKRNAREAINPKTGEKIHIEEKLAPSFKPSKTFKEYINE